MKLTKRGEAVLAAFYIAVLILGYLLTGWIEGSDLFL